MMDYVILTWPWGQAAQAALSLRQTMEAQSPLSCVIAQPRLLVFTRPGQGLKLHALPGQGGIILGDLFDRAASNKGLVAPPDLSRFGGLESETIAASLIETCWGSYVAVLTGDQATGPLILRSPMGEHEAFFWTQDDVTLVTSGLTRPRAQETPCALPRPLWPVTQIDWTCLAQILCDRSHATQTLPLKGVEALAPGFGAYAQEPWSVIDFWKPARFCKQAQARSEHDSDNPKTRLQQALVQTVETCLAALVDPQDKSLCELSGGLDSAIIASCLCAIDRAPAEALHVYWQTPEGDERLYAKAVADHLNLDLSLWLETPAALGLDDLKDFGLPARPSFNGIDPVYDQILAQRAQAIGATTLVTGQGGDAVFYQMAHPGLALDILLSKAAWTQKARHLAALSARARTSVWKLLGQALIERQGMGLGKGIWGKSTVLDTLLTAKTKTLAAAKPQGRGGSNQNAWLSATANLALAKRVQLQALINNLSVLGTSRRGAAARLIHPLLAQPIVELCLSIPAHDLAGGVRDRALAREAFSLRLPSLVTQRRGKGDVSRYFSRMVTMSLPILRPHLLEGRLVANGLLDGDALDRLLEADVLIHCDASAEIMGLAVLESWLARWEGTHEDPAT